VSRSKTGQCSSAFGECAGDENSTACVKTTSSSADRVAEMRDFHAKPCPYSFDPILDADEWLMCSSLQKHSQRFVGVNGRATADCIECLEVLQKLHEDDARMFEHVICGVALPTAAMDALQHARIFDCMLEENACRSVVDILGIFQCAWYAIRWNEVFQCAHGVSEPSDE
jgi:hypothetical protein